ncbi:protein of unknown function [Pustulibacterium marinum]|uniref:SusE outer membrane protein domain-containing protein n=1 Tax=Pustulibacterium marinum TaxID=1224947 RepID=A0A1I7GEC3_9FLAO|nr:SusE domain-containing protein [Pustulibacterium marinum]SFU46819.1 protein of unknown function [Pustulibacterium marinum]
MLAILVFSGMACEDDAELTMLAALSFPAEIQTSATEIILSEENTYEPVVAFSWEEVVYHIDAQVTYTLAIDTEADIYGETAWDNAQRITVGGDVLSKQFSGSELNTIATELGLPADVASEVFVRVEAYMDRYVYSNPIAISVTPFTPEVLAGQLYVPGAYQGWDPASAAVLNEVESGVYQGFVTFPEELGLEFKITPEPNWDISYGYDANGNFALANDTSNLSVPVAGSYMLTVNTNTMTFTATAYSWGIIGPATPDGWDADTDMVYDYQNQQWTFSGDLNAGALKFRLNNEWTINYGTEDGNSGEITDALVYLDNPGAHTILEPGTYTVTFVVDPNAPETATYSVIAQ